LGKSILSYEFMIHRLSARFSSDIHMKHRTFLLILLCPFLFSSCRDTPVKVQEDRVEYMEDFTKIINKVADGSMSSSDAAKKIKAHGKKGEELLKRTEASVKDLSPEQRKALEDKYVEKHMKAFKEYVQAVEKLKQSGRATQELADAIENMKE